MTGTIVKRELMNYLKNPVFWAGLLVICLGIYSSVSPYLQVRYFTEDEASASEDNLASEEHLTDFEMEQDIMNGYIRRPVDEQMEMYLSEIKNNLVEIFELSADEAEQVIQEISQNGWTVQETASYLKETYRYYSAEYLYEFYRYKHGTPEEANTYIDEQLNQHSYSYYFARKFADFTGLFICFFSVILFAFLFMRDVKKDMYELLHTKPISPAAYITGKYLGGLSAMGLILVIVTVIFTVISSIHGIRQGFPISVTALASAVIIYVIPNVLMILSVYTCVALLFKNPLPAAPMLILYIIYSNMGRRGEDGLYGYYGRPLAILVRFTGDFFDTELVPYVKLNQLFLLLASAGLIVAATTIWKRRKVV